jgi:hypothetical protein
LVIPNYLQLDDAVRRQAECNVRAAVRSRRNAAKRRKRLRQLSAQTTPSPNVPSSQDRKAGLSWDRNYEAAFPRPNAVPQGQGRPVRP